MTKQRFIRYFIVTPILIGISFISLQWFKQNHAVPVVQNTVSQTVSIPSPKPSLPHAPAQKILTNTYHIFQTYNNCGPAAFSMALSYYGIQESQEKLGQALRPYQVPGGDNDDKSVTLAELAEKSKEYGFTPFHRPNGRSEQIKQFIAHDMPVIVRTWLKVNEDIGHYRIIKGYDDTKRVFIQDDSLQGKNLSYSYEDFNAIWQKFNYEYLVLVPENKVSIANVIIGDDTDFITAWTHAVTNAEQQLEQNPDDVDARFNLSVALYHTKNYQRSVEEFEKVENRLSSRTLWYQIEPIHAYYALGNYDRVMQITNKILTNHNRAFSELYILRGEIYKAQGNTEMARQEFEKAVTYNQNLKAAQEALQSVQEISLQ